jgi:glycosyltransferase involved in cell wall biosynthesis
MQTGKRQLRMRCRATVIIPTFGEAGFARWAIKSVQDQTVKDIEIRIICDGSPEHMVSFFKKMEDKDPRIKVFVYPKSPRTGEPYRDIVIKESTGRIIAYCSHDDLWLPFHLAKLEKALKRYGFAHTIHASVNTPEAIRNSGNMFLHNFWVNLWDPAVLEEMLTGMNFFGLTFAAHTRDCYDKLAEGWATTPADAGPTDRYMWLKFLSQFKDRCRTVPKVTALNFRRLDRVDWSEQETDDELRTFYEKIQDPSFLKKIDALSRTLKPASRFREEVRYFFKGLGNYFYR